jgi:hypothetical protein
VAYRVEPIFMKFYSQIEPIHLYGPSDPEKVPYSEQPLRHLQAARKEEDKNEAGIPVLPVNIANGSINISVGKMAAGIGNQVSHGLADTNNSFGLSPDVLEHPILIRNSNLTQPKFEPSWVHRPGNQSEFENHIIPMKPC